MRRVLVAGVMVIAVLGAAIGLGREPSAVHGAERAGTERTETERTGAESPGLPATGQWNMVAAAHYLDAREAWWQGWKPAQRDHGTVCISCHTTVPYAMARGLLRERMGETGAAAEQTRLLASVETRVGHWGEMVPFYSDAENGPGKTAQSHATEAVLNAVVLAMNDGARREFRPVTEQALAEAWALQERTGESAGGWIWQDFHLAPWESTESGYQGAALLMVALSGREGYRQRPEVREPVEALRRYLRRGFAAQPMLNKLYVLWAARRDAALVTATDRTSTLAALRAMQQSDGGWSASALDGRPADPQRPEMARSDGYASALAVLALDRRHSDEVGMRARGVAWLRGHQRADGAWETTSLNKARDPQSNIGLFMSDAATGYAVLALAGQDQPAESAATP